MASTDIFTATDSELVARAATFVTYATANQAVLGLGLPDIAAVTADSTAYATDYSALLTARDAAKGATQTKDTARHALLAEVRALAKRIYANPAVTPTMIAALGLPVHKTTRTAVIPVPPASLVAVGYANGDNKLTWSPNGNSSGVIYWLEESPDGETWDLFGTTTKSRFTQPDQAPGVMKYYRVRATNSSLISAPSNEAVVYPMGSTMPALHVAA